MENSKEMLKVSVQTRIESASPSPTQSANTLFRFFTKPEYLFSTIENHALIPRYYGENVDYLDIGHHQIYYPMICFCDITIHRLSEHLKVYGQYGIAFSKAWGIENGIQPLQYVNAKSALCSDFSKAFISAINNEADTAEANFLLTQMYYMKPIEGNMPRDGKDIFKNFTDECEWRFIPPVVTIDLPQIVSEDDAASIGKLNDTIFDHDSCWLKFDYSDVKYIIIPDESELPAVCDVIEHSVSDKEIQRKLISKIILWSDAKEDF
jgi:hypothetical protein